MDIAFKALTSATGSAMQWVEIIAERKIEAARQSGVFDDLPGAGKPLPPEMFVGEWDPGVHLLKHAAMLPDWLGLRHEIGQLQTGLRSWLAEGGVEEVHPVHSGQPSLSLGRRVEEINRLIDQHNLRAPSLTWQLPRLSISDALHGAAMQPGRQNGASSIPTGFCTRPPA